MASDVNSWTAKNIPDLDGKVAIVTGANSGIGYATAQVLAHKKAAVILACRSQEKGQAAVRQILQEFPQAEAEFMQLDLADLGSVRHFAGEFSGRYGRLDMIINNAGIMRTPFSKTADGFESQFATNHLGHFALTCLLLELIIRSRQGRVISVSSGGERFGKIDFDNLNGEKGYDPGAAYAQSKLANLLFTYELQRQFETAKVDAIAAAAHPGWTETNLQVHWPMVRFFNRFIAQQPDMGALPILYAATAPDVQGGDYYAPDGWMELKGYPTKVRSSDRSYDPSVAARLWEVSEALTGVCYQWPTGHRS